MEDHLLFQTEALQKQGVTSPVHLSDTIDESREETLRGNLKKTERRNLEIYYHNNIKPRNQSPRENSR